MKKDAIQQKKDLRLKRLSYKKHVQMDDDQELNMIMNYNSSAKQEVSQANSDQKTEESNISLGMPTFYQQHGSHQNNQDKFYNMRSPNEDLINLENSLHLQQEQEKRSKRQQQQLQEQQFRLSMSSMKNQISEVIKEELNESQRSNTGRDSPKEINESMI